MAARILLVAGNLAVALAMLATRGTDLGRRHLHDEVAWALLALAALAGVPLLRRRRVTTLLLASAASWSILTGLLLVLPPAGALETRWMRWWHSVTSMAFLLAFLAHWVRNNARLWGLAGALARRRAALLAFAALWGLAALAVVASWTTPLRALFQERYLPELTFLSLGLALAGALGVALAMAARDPADAGARNAGRGAVDASLLAAAWLASLTGFLLPYLARALRALGAYWHVIGWHAAAGALLVGLALCHAGLNARPLAAHLRPRKA